MAGSDFYFVEVLGDRNALRNLDRLPDTVRAILLEKTRGWTEQLEEKIVDNILDKLGEKSGKLAGAVKRQVTEVNGRIEGTVSISGVPYARIQDKGGVTPPHEILPRNSKVLAFIGATGGKVFATRVFHPGGVIPATNYTKDAYREMGPIISRGIKTAIVQGIRAKMRQS